MAARDPNAVSAKWAKNLGQATEEIRAGVNAVQQAPGQKAAAAADLWLQRVQASRAKFARNVSRVTLDQWKTAMIDKGLNRVGTGANAAIPKMQSFMAEFLPHVDRIAQQVRAMPKGDLAASEARMVAQMRGNAQFKRGGSGA